MIDIAEKLENHSLRSLKDDVDHLLHKFEIYENKIPMDLLSDQLMSLFKSWLVSFDKWHLDGLINDNGLDRLESIIDKYEDICSDGFTKEFVLRTYKFERFGTSIDFTAQDLERIMNLEKELDEFFFVTHVFANDDSQNALFLSRFKNYVEDPLEQYKDHCGFFDGYADKAGIIFDYLPKEVAWFCSKNYPELLK